MAELLIKAIDHVHPDPVKDRRGAYKAGYPVVVFENGHLWGPGEGPPTFIVLKVPDVTRAQIEHYIQHWRDDFDYEILDTRPAQGEFDVRVFEKNVSAAGLNAMTQAKVEAFLARWGCEAITAAANSVSFTFNLWNAARSEGFWEIPLIGTKVDFALNSYTPATGIANITATLNESAFGPFDDKTSEQIQAMLTERTTRRITEMGGTVMAQAYPAFTYELERSDILTKFRSDVKRRGEGTFCRRQYQLPVEDVNTALAGDGTITMTSAELIARIRNKMVEE